jgi:hypothetical protein
MPSDHKRVLTVTDAELRLARNQLRRLRSANTAKPDEAEQRFLDKVFAADRVTGWKEIAHFLGRDESAVRTAYKGSAAVRREIHKTGGRYWSTPGALMNVATLFWDRRAQARQSTAFTQSRGTRGKFSRG